MIMEFEENFLDNIISECTSNTLFDEYVNYDQIVSESLVLSETQQIKLDILREFSIKDIGKRIAGAFKAIKTFISNLILKLNVFIKNIGKEKIFRDVGKALTELSPEERKEKIEFYICKSAILVTNDEVIKNIDNCINYVMKVLKSNSIGEDTSYDELKKYGIFDVEDLEIGAKFDDVEWVTKSGTKIEAYKYYTMLSKNLDKEYNYFTKLSNKISNQADKLEKLADRWRYPDKDEGAKIAVSIVRKLLLPAMKKNVNGLKKFTSLLAKENKRLLTETISLIKGDKSAIKDIKFDAGTEDSTNESYTPWNDLD